MFLSIFNKKNENKIYEKNKYIYFNMPNTKRGTINVHIPIKQNGEKDKRYTNPQFCNKDGKRDMRCNLMNENQKKKNV